MLNFLTTHRILLSRLLPDEPDDLVLRQGQFHNVVIGSERVVCLPRSRAAGARLPERAATLRALAGFDLGVRTPEPLAQDEIHSSNEAPYLILSRIPGEPLETDALNDAYVAGTVAEQYATLLTQLIRAGMDETVRAVLPHASEGRWRQFAENVREELFEMMSERGRLRAEQELAALSGLPHITQAVVHGDLGAENVLWEWEHGLPRLAGVLDWDDVALSDPAEDLAAIGAGYGNKFLDQVLALGTWPDNRLAARIAAIRGTFALQQALYALRDEDEEELADGLSGYR